METLPSQIKPLITLAIQAGDQIMTYFGQQEKLEARRKSDHTFLTQADLAAHAVIKQGLLQLDDVPILSEEGEIPDFSIRKSWSEYWLVDPLDGTQGFVNNVKEFSVNIARISQHKPVLGVIYLPFYRLVYFGIKNGGAFKFDVQKNTLISIKTKSFTWDSFQVLVGLYLGTDKKLLSVPLQNKGCEILRVNSSFKLGLIAEGKADLYPRFGLTGEWDTAAGQCILKEAQGAIFDFNGEELQYNRKDSLINPPFLAMGDPSKFNEIAEFLKHL